MACINRKFWLESPVVLLNNIQVVPIYTIGLAEQLNAITRLVLIVTVIMWLFNFKYTGQFLAISLAFIICVYYIQRRDKMNKEQYQKKVVENFDGKLPRLVPVQSYNMKNLATSRKVNIGGHIVDQSIISTSEVLPFCNDEVSIDPPNPFAVSLNQSLVGKANPVTNIKPIVVPPLYALDYWKDNNLIRFSQINTAGPQEDMYLSGYAESTCCGYLGDGAELVPQKKEQKSVLFGGGIREDYCNNQNRILPPAPKQKMTCRGGIVSPIPVEDRPYIPTMEVRNPVVNTAKFRENYAPRGGCGNRIPNRGCSSIVSPTPVEDRPFVPTMRVQDNPEMPVIGTPFVENYRYETIPDPNEVFVQPNRSGWVNTACGYNPDQVFESGLPSNFPAGNCEQSPDLKQYNENMFTSIVTPGVFTRTQVNEPINSNIGISFQQQFEPVTCQRNEKGLIYTQHDPRIIEPVLESEIPQDCVREKATYDNVYDPRFYGYGTSYRSYTEPVTSQTRFFYDDVNAVRMPTYITRSKIDHLPYADTYQSPPDGSEMGNVHNPHIRALVQDSWFRDSLQFRNDLTERRMRKVNSEAWQQRMYPNSSRPVGSNRH